ncbi:hypothetical protein [uncultured Legionella sp.]|uniref:hypothetical protein n=1 Tax=uncultured Legionella sp. TaxID=210934 RepID=UPI002607E497|nr:hypothetical protein [uncultured Legionella sp.]
MIKRQKEYLLAVATSLLLGNSIEAIATTPTSLWEYSIPTPQQVTVTEGETATVLYTVTNKSPKPKNLILKTTPGTSGIGASACHLAGKGSTCILTITVTGSLIPKQGVR